jgi:hypothetical protein
LYRYITAHGVRPGGAPPTSRAEARVGRPPRAAVVRRVGPVHARWRAHPRVMTMQQSRSQRRVSLASSHRSRLSRLILLLLALDYVLLLEWPLLRVRTYVRSSSGGEGVLVGLWWRGSFLYANSKCGHSRSERKIFWGCKKIKVTVNLFLANLSSSCAPTTTSTRNLQPTPPR